MKKMTVSKNPFQYFDWITFIIICVIVLLGLIMITNATANPFSGSETTISEIMENLDLSSTILQLTFFLAGVGILFALLLLDYSMLRHYVDWIYIACVVLLVAVYFWGSKQRGTVGWFMIGERGFQPSEFCKLALILVVSKTLADKTEGNENGITKFSQLWPALWRFTIPFILVAIQPDMGTALVFVAIFFGILFIAKTSLKMFGILFGIAGATVPIFIFTLKDYQTDRLFTFFETDPTKIDPDLVYQSEQAKLAIGSGQLQGRGLFAPGSISQLGYLPERHNDFIFAVTVEAWGFIGAALLLALYGALIVRTIMLGIRAKDDFGTFICIGVASMMLFHIFQNIGMNIGLMPITGISLPFYSYGGSYLLTSLMAYAMVLNVDMRRVRRSF